jgi:hypothetical protein
MAERVIILEEELRELYSNKKLNTYQIAEKFDCCQATIWKTLIRFGITRRKSHELNSNVPSKEELIRLYSKDKLSTWQIEKKFGYSRGTVHRKLKEHKIPTRDRADSHIFNERNDFSGNLIEKAYLIGFRLGDLGVRKIWPNSKTICVASGSTIKEQIDLIKSLFEPYCKVWIGKAKNGKINIQAPLNESFSFLLSKEFPEWVAGNRQNFFSFLAGFSDAEGNFGVYNNMARYQLGNYDYQLLLKIKDCLNNFNIPCSKLYVGKMKGRINKQGYKYNSDYYTIRIHRKEELLKLNKEIKPFIKHKNKIKDLNKMITNIIERNNKYGKK